MNLWRRIVQLAYHPHVIRLCAFTVTLLLGVIAGALYGDGVIWGD